MNHKLVRRWIGVGILALALPLAAAAQEAFSRGTANLRAGPSGDYPLVARLGPGQPFEVLGCTRGYSWCDVVLPDGLRGWLYAANIDYAYEDRRVPLASYGAMIGVPIVGFTIGNYWADHYRDRPWYGEPRWWHGHRPPPPVAGWRPVPPPRPAWRPNPWHDRDPGYRPHPGQGVRPHPDWRPPPDPGVRPPRPDQGFRPPPQLQPPPDPGVRPPRPDQGFRPPPQLQPPPDPGIRPPRPDQGFRPPPQLQPPPDPGVRPPRPDQGFRPPPQLQPQSQPDPGFRPPRPDHPGARPHPGGPPPGAHPGGGRPPAPMPGIEMRQRQQERINQVPGAAQGDSSPGLGHRP